MKKTQNPKPKSQSLTIGWLYPDLMSTYGDSGNILVLKKRSEWRGIQIEIVNIDQNTTDTELKSVNILFGGGAQDREQKIVISDLIKKKEILKELIENDIPALFVCGSPQLFGKYYEPSAGVRIEGLGIFDMESIHPGPKSKRLIGNVVARIEPESFAANSQGPKANGYIVGFENHGGRTYLGKNARPFAKIIKGFGNNGEDRTEGIIYKNAIGSYLHGPLLPKNPEIADWLIKKALEVKYKETITFTKIDDEISEKAKGAIAKRLGIKI